jgi:hypothetical protein
MKFQRWVSIIVRCSRFDSATPDWPATDKKRLRTPCGILYAFPAVQGGASM